MSKPANPSNEIDRPVVYEIRIGGRLGSQWMDWFEGLAISVEASGNTLITGPVADQAALFGLLKKVRDLGIPLVSVIPLETDQSEQSDVKSESDISNQEKK
jgi:hypothetical protein